MMKKNSAIVMGIIILVVLLVLSFLSILHPAHDEDAHRMNEEYQKPSFEHWFGTGRGGYDLFYLVISGIKYTILVALAILFLRMLIALPIGLLTGINGGLIQKVLRKIATTLSAIPLFLISFALLARITFNEAIPITTKLIIFIIINACVGAPIIAYTISKIVERINQEPFVEGALILGASKLYLLRKHIFPHMKPYLISLLITEIVHILWLMGHLGIFNIFVGGTLVESSPGLIIYYSITNELAGLLAQNFSFIIVRQTPWLALFPAAVFVLIIFAFNLIAEGIRKREQAPLRGVNL